MPRREWWGLLLCGGCAFSGEIDPVTPAGMVSHLLEGRLSEGALVLVPPDEVDPQSDLGGPTTELVAAHRADDGALVAAFHQWSEDGVGGPFVVRVEGADVERLPIEGSSDPLYGAALLEVDGGVLLSACVSPPGLLAWAGPGEGSLAIGTSPFEACPEAWVADGDGGFWTAHTDAGGYALRRFALAGGGWSEVEALTLPGAGSALRIGVEGGAPWVIGGDGSALVWSTPAGAVAGPAAGFSAILRREGEDVLYAPDGPGALYRWTPGTGAQELVGEVETDGRTWLALGRDGVLQVAVAPWEEVSAGSVVTGTWWVAPDGAGGYGATELGRSPCDTFETCLEVGEWFALGALGDAGGGHALWLLWSWLGPSAVVATPL